MSRSFTHVHKKTGNYYRVVGRGYDVANGREPVAIVAYQDATGELWTRDAREFDDGRFEELTAV